MGSLFGSSLISGGRETIWNPPANVPGPAPTPDNFQVERSMAIGRAHSNTQLYVSEITYPGCTNFEGRKIVITEFDPRMRRSLDPHFLPGNGVLARYEPTARGWRWAVAAAAQMQASYP